jgi:ABC-type protease/lipase transport system fused ATPase/permease subunit
MGETKMKRLKSMVCAAVISCTLIVPASAQMNSMSSSTKTTTTGMGNMSNTQTHEKMTTHSTSIKPMVMQRHHKRHHNRHHNRAVHHTMTKSTTTTTEAK